MKTYDDVINEFFHQLVQIPIGNRTYQLRDIVQKLQTSNLEVAKRVLERLNSQYVQPQMEETNKLLSIENFAVNDYQSSSRAYQNFISNPNNKPFLDKWKFENYKILEARALEKNNPSELSKIAKKGNEMLQDNEYMKMDYHIQKWEQFLKEEQLFSQYEINTKSAA